jgi:heme-degrading monooxygenase HmoA
MIANTPAPPYYAVIFTSIKVAADDGYEAMANEMEALARQQPGFLGFESARNDLGISVSYWQSPEAIAAWKQNERHLIAQQKGKAEWYKSYRTRVCRVERDYGM